MNKILTAEILQANKATERYYLDRKRRFNIAGVPICEVPEVYKDGHPNKGWQFWTECYSGVPFFYVHELENLIFAMTGYKVEII
jgi:hypothetical protein